MKNNLITQIITASKIILKKKVYLGVFLFLIPCIGFLLYLIPVAKIPGNSITFQTQLFSAQDYVLIVLVAALESLLLVMFFYLFRLQRERKLATAGQESLGLLSGIPAFLFGAKLCPICIAAIFGVFGPGAVLFTLQYRQWIFVASVIVLIYSLYAVSKKVNGVCGSCKDCEARL